MTQKTKPVPAEVYSKDYFLSECEGYEAYLDTGGQVLSPRLQVALEQAGAVQDLQILDLGCGRGELLRHCASQGARVVGIDYSADALSLAQSILPKEIPLLRADARQLPLSSDALDLVFALDIVEHLHQDELEQMLAEVYRVLAPQGRFIVHTMPNVWYYRYGYPLYRLVQRLRGVRLPRDPRERWRFVKQVHVNEQSLTTLARNLRGAGFRARVFLRNTQTFAQEKNPLVRGVSRFLTTTFPLALIFCDELFAVAVKDPIPDRGRD